MSTVRKFYKNTKPTKATKNTKTKQATLLDNLKGKANAKKVKVSKDSNSDKVYQILSKFDAEPKFGPALGISRINRWKRAEMLKLKPPKEIYNLLKDMIDEQQKS